MSEFIYERRQEILKDSSLLEIKELPKFFIESKHKEYELKNTIVKDFNFIIEENKNSLINFFEHYQTKIISAPIFQIPSRTFTRPSLTPFAPVVERAPLRDDFGYTFLRNPTDRRELLDRMIEILVSMDAVGVNALVFCDRGARPLATLAANLWGAVSERPLPAVFFINTDPKHQYQNPSEIPDEVMDQVRDWLLTEHQEGENPFREGEAVVCVVDETKGSGRSAQFVAGIVQRAFPGQTKAVYTGWVNAHGASEAWRNMPDRIGADTVRGDFKSRKLTTKQAELLEQDLIRLAQDYEAGLKAGVKSDAAF